MPALEIPVLMFTALLALYNPLASLSSYFPVLKELDARAQTKLALALFGVVTTFVMLALWLGEPLLELIGLSTSALTVTGGIALLFAGIPLMRGLASKGGGESEGEDANASGSWRSVLFMPVFFPLTAGGTTFATLICFRAQTSRLVDALALSVAGLCYAGVTAATIYASGHLQRRVKPRTVALLERVAGILLVAIAVSLLAKGIPKMVVETLKQLEARSTSSAAGCRPISH